VVFVTGEPGIGKTALLDLFRSQLQTDGHLTIGYGQCVEQYGGGEAYLPIFEALGRLCHRTTGPLIVATLRRYAPTWLVQLSGVIDEGEAQALRVQAQGVTQHRMLRELAEALEQLTYQQPLLLILEDLHWSDHATIALLSYLAQRRERTRLLVIGAYRPADLVLGNHPLQTMQHELQAKHQCEEVRVALLSPRDVGDYLARRFPQQQFPATLAAEIHQRTEGNALFMVNVVEELLQQGHIANEQGHWTFAGDGTQVYVPDTLRQLIETQIQQRSEQAQRTLEVASVVGTEFVVAAVSAALKQKVEEVEEVCEQLAKQGHFVEERGIAEWPDGTMSGRYAFRHALYQNVLYDRIAETRRVRWHRTIGERLETGYGEKTKEIAAELAAHFQKGRDYPRTVQYLEQAGRNAIQRSGYGEAILHLTNALALLNTLPDMPERTQRELTLQTALGTALMVTKGYAAPEVGRVFARAHELCQQIGETPRLFPILHGLGAFYLVRAELQTVRELGEQCLRLAQRTAAPTLLLAARAMLGMALFYGGEFTAAREHFEQGIVLYDPLQYGARAFHASQHYWLVCLTWEAWTLWLLGYPDQALETSSKAVQLAQEMRRPHSLVATLSLTNILHQFLRKSQSVRELSDARLPFVLRRDSKIGERQILSTEVGPSPCKAKERKVLRNFAKDWLPFGPPGRRSIGRAILLCWLRRTEKRGRHRKGWPYSLRH
jgi:tetratricopeptide (TPR) repeat protein